MNGKAKVIANHRRSCFDKLSTNGLAGKQDLSVGIPVYFYLTKHYNKSKSAITQIKS